MGVKKKIVRPQKSWGPELWAWLHSLRAGPSYHIINEYDTTYIFKNNTWYVNIFILLVVRGNKSYTDGVYKLKTFSLMCMPLVTVQLE
jgi:hypothetical protein